MERVKAARVLFDTAQRRLHRTDRPLLLSLRKRTRCREEASRHGCAANHHLGSQRSALSGRQGESEQARAQEQEARRSYRQKPIRYEVMITHSAPANLDARPNLLKFSERAH